MLIQRIWLGLAKGNCLDSSSTTKNPPLLAVATTSFYCLLISSPKLSSTSKKVVQPQCEGQTVLGYSIRMLFAQLARNQPLRNNRMRLPILLRLDTSSIPQNHSSANGAIEKLSLHAYDN